MALLCSGAHAGQVLVAVAANFAAPMQKIAAAFEASTLHTIKLSIGSTGGIYAQVRNGAPYDVFLAADDETPARLQAEGFAVRGSRFTYARGRLVLWSANPALVDAKGDVLARGAFDKIAIADPKLAPYGTAAVETMQRIGVYDKLRPKIVQGANIGQAFQFVTSGSAPLGFVALSQVMTDGRIMKGSAWVVPLDLHSPLRQDAVVLTRGAANPAAADLADFLRSEKARGIIRAYGYEL
jgi:molybdate transport system substrate-binding protein